MRLIKEIIVHCTATPEGKDYGAKDIDRWHRAQGWDGIGYHYVVRLDGTVEKGRADSARGAHCVNHNAQSIGVVYVGGISGKDGTMPKDTRTPAQKQSLRILLSVLRAVYPEARIYGHRDFAAKACPCFDAKTEYKDL